MKRVDAIGVAIVAAYLIIVWPARAGIGAAIREAWTR